MNPLPNRPLLNNSTLPLQLPNVPSFEQIAFNGRPRKTMPEVGKEFPLLNGMGMMSGPHTQATSSNQMNPLDRAGLAGVGIGLQHPQGSLGQLQQPASSSQISLQSGDGEKKEGEGEPNSLTAIFRADEAGDWKEKLRMSHDASEQARLDRVGQQSLPSVSGAMSWERRAREEDEEGKEEEPDVEDEDGSVLGESESSKIWKAKRTLRK